MIFVFGGCTDKYVSLKTIDVAPILVTNKDSLKIRIKDYSNYYKGAGFLKISTIDTLASGYYLKCYDSSGHLEVFQDSVKINGQKIAINQPAIVYIACKDTGIYPLTIQVIDQMGKMSQKIVSVRVIENMPATPDLKIIKLSSIPGQGHFVLDASNSYAPLSRIISYSFSINGSETILFHSSIKTMLYTGVHDIELKVYDDLGLCSPSYFTTITVE